MPAPILGANYHVYLPENDELIALGYTHIRVYWASSEGGSYSLATSIALVSGTYDYTYNKTDGLATDWAYHALYGATPGEGAASDPIPVGNNAPSRKLIRQGVGQRLKLCELATVTTYTNTTSFACSSLADSDGAASDKANYFARVASGARAGDIRRLRTAANSGWASTTGTVALRRPLGGALSVADEIEFWKPKGNVDPSAQIDEAMQRARRNIWIEDVFYLVTEADQTPYALPRSISHSGQVKRVEYSPWGASEFTTEPRWLPVGDARVWVEDGQCWLEVHSDPVSRAPLAGGLPLRVTVNRNPDRMDSESDSWPVPLEWAVAEVALQFLTENGPETGKEDVGDIGRLLPVLRDECMEFRALYTPATTVRVELPR